MPALKGPTVVPDKRGILWGKSKDGTISTNTSSARKAAKKQVNAENAGTSSYVSSTRERKEAGSSGNSAKCRNPTNPDARAPTVFS
jgi:hypothetical protein